MGSNRHDRQPGAKAALCSAYWLGQELGIFPRHKNSARIETPDGKVARDEVIKQIVQIYTRPVQIQSR